MPPTPAARHAASIRANQPGPSRRPKSPAHAPALARLPHGARRAPAPTSPVPPAARNRPLMPPPSPACRMERGEQPAPTSPIPPAARHRAHASASSPPAARRTASTRANGPTPAAACHRALMPPPPASLPHEARPAPATAWRAAGRSARPLHGGWRSGWPVPSGSAHARPAPSHRAARGHRAPRR